MMRLGGVNVVDAVRMTPARYLGLSDRGTLAVGKRADIVLFDGDVHVKRVPVRGEAVV